MLKFINSGSDESLLKALSNDERYTEEIKKAFRQIDKTKNHLQQIQVKGKHGVYTKMAWVSNDEPQIKKLNNKKFDFERLKTKPTKIPSSQDLYDIMGVNNLFTQDFRDVIPDELLLYRSGNSKECKLRWEIRQKEYKPLFDELLETKVKDTVMSYLEDYEYLFKDYVGTREEYDEYEDDYELYKTVTDEIYDEILFTNHSELQIDMLSNLGMSMEDLMKHFGIRLSGDGEYAPSVIDDDEFEPEEKLAVVLHTNSLKDDPAFNDCIDRLYNERENSKPLEDAVSKLCEKYPEVSDALRGFLLSDRKNDIKNAIISRLEQLNYNTYFEPVEEGEVMINGDPDRVESGLMYEGEYYEDYSDLPYLGQIAYDLQDDYDRLSRDFKKLKGKDLIPDIISKTKDLIRENNNRLSNYVSLVNKEKFMSAMSNKLNSVTINGNKVKVNKKVWDTHIVFTPDDVEGFRIDLYFTDTGCSVNPRISYGTGKWEREYESDYDRFYEYEVYKTETKGSKDFTNAQEAVTYIQQCLSHPLTEEMVKR